MMLQESLNILASLFERVGLVTNMKKTQTMTCTPGKIQVRLNANSYYRRQAGFGSRKAWSSRRVECDQYGASLTASSLPSHLETQHGVYHSDVLEEEYLSEDPEVLYRA